MGAENTTKSLRRIKIDKPIRNTDDFQSSKIDLIEHCNNITFYIGCIGHMQKEYHLTEQKILSARRSNREMLEIRMFICWLVKRNTSMTDGLLCRLMNVDRTSCIYLYNNFQMEFTQLTQEEQDYWLDIEKEIYDTVNSQGKIKQSVAPAIKKRMTRSYIPLKDTEKYIKSNYKEIDYEYEVKQFRDYYLSTGDVRYDWDSSFRYWIRRSFKMDSDIQTRRTNSKTSRVVATNDQRIRENSDRHKLESIPPTAKLINKH